MNNFIKNQELYNGLISLDPIVVEIIANYWIDLSSFNNSEISIFKEVLNNKIFSDQPDTMVVTDEPIGFLKDVIESCGFISDSVTFPWDKRLELRIEETQSSNLSDNIKMELLNNNKQFVPIILGSDTRKNITHMLYPEFKLM
jgi:hypothetical protein